MISWTSSWTTEQHWQIHTLLTDPYRLQRFGSLVGSLKLNKSKNNGGKMIGVHFEVYIKGSSDS